MPSPLIGGVKHTDSGLLEVTDLTASVQVVLLLEGQHCLRLRPAFIRSLLRSAVQIQSHHLLSGMHAPSASRLSPASPLPPVHLSARCE
jgi:hypothetical protein